MHRQLTRRVRTGDRDERGAVAVMVAISLSALLVAAGLVLDFGLVRIDRQVDKSAADAATVAGLQGLTSGGGDPRSFNGVCTALRFLQANSARFSGISSTGGTWTNGAGTATANGCTDTTLNSKICIATDQTTWAKYRWTGTYQGGSVEVKIQSGYVLPATAAAATWEEDTLSAALDAKNSDDSASGCRQLAVTITESRQPTFGSLATASDLYTAVRSVGRTTTGPGGYAPAMILLKQTGCNILTAGSSAGGSKVYVKGAVSADGVNTQPGTIHSDSDASGCGSNENIYTGQANNGIVAYAAPLVSNPTSPDTSKPGSITAYAAQQGVTGSKLRDSTSRVCGSAGIFGTGTCPGTDVLGRARIYRKPVDDRYLAGAQGVRNAANTAAFTAMGSAPPATLSGYTTIPGGCSPTQAQVNGLSLTAASKVYSPCTANNGFTAGVTINAGTVVFAGKVNPASGTTLSLPNATAVYVYGSSSDGLMLSGSTFSVHSLGTSNLNGTQCKDTPSGSATNKAVLVIKNGNINESNNANLQLCYTTVVMMGGQSTACMPATPSQAAPNPSTPCAGTAGTGQLKQTGGSVDWTAPNRYSVMNLTDGTPDPAKSGEWLSAAGPEDLAFWSESGGTSSSPKFQMTGGGTVHLVGVFMTPNAEPFNLSGQFSQTLVNAQYVASSIQLSSNNTQITMSVDPNAAVTLPKPKLIGLVR